MSKIFLSLIFHNHQPVGNFDFVFDEAFEKAYRPLTDCLARHPTVKATLHFTGPLLDWLRKHQPGYLETVADLVERGQLEILSGGYYEPILSMLHDADKVGQIHKMTAAVQELFGQTPRGMWLAERIWEPHFAKPLHEAGIDYTILDDAHFKAAGFTPEDLFGYFVTEEQGHPLKLIPTQTRLRYLIPWRPVEEAIGWLHEQAQNRNVPGQPPPWAVMGDDGEKFGLWPETYDSIWGEDWMDRFFEALEANDHWLETIHPADYIDRFRAKGVAYLPTASYMEMGEWALPAPQSWYLRDLREQYELQLEYLPDWDHDKRTEIENILQFLRGSFWRNFLVKYPEINHMYKRSLALSRRIHRLPGSDVKDMALDALWAAQCNCAYWHGVFGGVYLFHIRAANYANLIRAETLAEELEDKPAVWIEQTDFNADSYDEVLVANGPLMAIVEPNLGGMMTELDYRPAFYNLLNIMSRHPEGYHLQIQEAAATNMLMTPGDDRSQFEGEPVRAKEKGLENHIHTDWHRRGLFVDHFLGEGANLHNFEAAQYPEQGDFANQHYRVTYSNDDTEASLTLTRDGHVWVGDVHLPVTIEKQFTFQRGQPSIETRYTLTNRGEIHLNSRFGIEIALGYDGGNDPTHYYIQGGDVRHGLGETAIFQQLSGYQVVSERHSFNVQVALDQAASLWHFPLAPITLSEGGFERVHQGMVLLQWWALDLAPEQDWTCTLTLDIQAKERR